VEALKWGNEWLGLLFFLEYYMDVQVYGFRFAKVKDSDEFMLIQSNDDDRDDVVRLSMYDLIILSELLNEAIGDRK
jgi:uncharacterized protein with ParB-like and HNH nuclease domain